MKTKIGFRKKSLVTAVSAATLIASQSFSVLAAGESALEEVIVTATRRAQSVQDIPFNISAVSGTALEEAGIIDAVDLIRSVAGISVIDRGYRNSGMTNGIVIRGINVDSGANGDVPLAAVPTVSTYIGDTALYGNFILKDIERVEVLRGPQGTLYGSGSLAGTVRYIMRKPSTEEFSGKVGGSYGVTDGSDGYNLGADLMLNIPMGDSFAIRANIGKIDNDGIVDYVNVYATDGTGDPIVNGDVATAKPVYTTVEDADTVDIEYVRASALYEPNDTFSALLSYQRQEDEVGGRRQVTRGDDLVNGGQYGDFENGAVMLEPSEREVEVAALELEVDLGFATLTSSTSDYNHEGVGISDNTGVYAQNRWLRFYYSSPRPFAQAERFYDDSAFAQEFRLVSNGANTVDWTVGLYYTDQDSMLGQNSYLKGYEEYIKDPAVGGFTIATEQDFKFRRNQGYEEIALFGEVTVNFTDDLHLTLGGRYFDNELDVDAFVEVPIWGGAPGEAEQSISEDDVLFKVNLAYDVSDDGMLYGTVSEGYRHGGANAVPTSGNYAESPEYFVFDSDSLINYEVGYKGSTENMTYTASLYYSDWQDPQLNTATNNWGFFGVINGESASTQGIEFEIAGQLTDSISYNAGYTYADAELTDDVYKPAGNFYGNLESSPLRQDLVAEDGDRLPGTAEHVFNVSFMHHTVFSNGLDLRTQLSGYYQSETINSLGSDDLNSPIYVNTAAEMEAFQLWNFISTLGSETWTASFFVKNIANEEGVTGLVTAAHMGSAPDAENQYFGNASKESISLPRTIGASFTFNF